MTHFPKQVVQIVDVMSNAACDGRLQRWYEGGSHLQQVHVTGVVVAPGMPLLQE